MKPSEAVGEEGRMRAAETGGAHSEASRELYEVAVGVGQFE